MKGGLASLLKWVILIAGVAGILYPALIEGPHGAPPESVSQAVLSIFLNPELSQTYFMRVLCLVVVICGGYIILISFWYRDTPITVVKTSINATFNHDLSRADIHREQIMRANRRDVTAYFTSSIPSSLSGCTPKSEITMDVFCQGMDATLTSFHSVGSDESGYAITHYFGAPLPYRWYMPLIPNWALNKRPEDLPGFIRNNLVIRRQRVVYVNEYNVDEPSMSFTVHRYPHMNFLLELHFPHDVPKSLIAERVIANGVIKVWYEAFTSKSARIRVDKMRSETLRVRW